VWKDVNAEEDMCKIPLETVSTLMNAALSDSYNLIIRRIIDLTENKDIATVIFLQKCFFLKKGIV